LNSNYYDGFTTLNAYLILGEIAMKIKVLIRTVFLLCIVSLIFLPAISSGRGLSVLKKKPGEVFFIYGDREIAPTGKGMKRAWGFLPLIHFDEKIIMFNAGGDPAILKQNMAVGKIKPEDIDILVIAHEDWYMYGGATYILKNNPKVAVYTTPKVKEILLEENEKWAKNIHLVDRTVIITPNIIVHEMKSMPRHGGRFGILSINLILKTKEGIVVFGGCGHVNVVDMLKEASHLSHESIVHMYIGGTHLLPPGEIVDLPGGKGEYTIIQEFRYSDEYVLKLISKLHELGLEKIVPTHCTGENAILRRIIQISFSE